MKLDPNIAAAIARIEAKFQTAAEVADEITAELIEVENLLNAARAKFEVTVVDDGDTFAWSELTGANGRFGFAVGTCQGPQQVTRAPLRYRLRLRKLIPQFLLLIEDRVNELVEGLGI